MPNGQILDTQVGVRMLQDKTPSLHLDIFKSLQGAGLGIVVG